MIARHRTHRVRAFCVGLAAIWTIVSAPTGWAAVSSTGEINVLDDPSGRVPTAAKPTLIITLLVDRSQAEQGEEIKTIEVFLPTGFSMTEADARDVKIEGVRVPYSITVSGPRVRFVLEKEIDNFLSSIIEIIFDVQTPDLPMKNALFRVAMRNLQDQQIGEFIKPGEIDGDPTNNNDYTLDVFPNVPPDTPANVSATPDPSGDNDVIVSWDPVQDRDVKGYFVFRDGAPPIDVPDAGSRSVRDVNVPPGPHSYSVAAYKSRLVVSPRSPEQAVTVEPDTGRPAPVAGVTISQVASGVELRWPPSASEDVLRYEVRFALFGETPEVVERIPVVPDMVEYSYVDRVVLQPGRYVYAIVAVDEAGNVSSPREETFVLADTPFPNPFTPLGSPPFDVVTFPRRAVPNAEGDLTVRIFDLRGRQVQQLTAPNGDVTWDGRDESGRLLPSGPYAYQMEISGQFRIGSIILIR